MKFMNKDMIDYLTEIYPRMSSLKITSRKFILYRIFQFGHNKKLSHPDILLEYNQNKHKRFEEMVGKQLFFFNPDKLTFPIRDKIILFSLLFCTQKHRDIYYASLLHRLINEYIDKKSNIYIFNPYSIWHYTFSFLRNYKTVYIHSCSYPIFSADSYYSPKFISDVYSLDRSNYYEVIPPHTFIQSLEKIKFYMTQLIVDSEDEKKLINFIHYLIESEGKVNIKIFIHYLDRGVDISKTKLSGLEDFISHEKSLDSISKNQISFSAGSSIGYELLSLGLNHYIFYHEPDMNSKYPELEQFIRNSDRFIKTSENFKRISDNLNL